MSIGVFVLFILFLVMKASQQHIPLVSDDYYERELDYENKHGKRLRAKAVRDAMNISTSGDTLLVVFPSEHQNIVGDLIFYRPSSSFLDRKLKVSVDTSNRSLIPIGDLKRGLWKLQIDWESDGITYYLEESLVL